MRGFFLAQSRRLSLSFDYNQHVSEAAASILALINSKPQSPRQDELEAIITRVAIAPGLGAAANHHRAEWDRLIEAYNAAEAKR
jgi:hypothetical protein